MSVLEFHNVSMTFGSGNTACCALTNIDLTIPKTQMVALTGASGSGKTTLLNLAIGLIKPSHGVVRLLGNDIGSSDETALARLRRKTIGFVFQTLNLLPTLSIAENVELPLILNRWPASARKSRVKELLSLSGLSNKRANWPDSLSTGEQQRIAILRAVAHKPRIVLLDEPTSCLDTHNSLLLMELLRELNHSEGITIVMTTHDMRMAETMERTLQLCDGKFIS